MIQSVDRAFKILECIAAEPERPHSLSEIARTLDLHLATCRNLLKTMVELDYVAQEGRAQGYTLGPQAYLLAAHGPFRKDLVLLAEPLMAELAGRIGETVILVTLHRGRRYTLAQVDGGRGFEVRRDLVTDQDVYRTATGRLLLAHMPADELESFVAATGRPDRDWPEARTLRGMARALRKIRDDGLATTEVHSDVVGIACPVREGQRVVAALGVFLPTFRFEGAHKEQVLAGLKEAADALSARRTEQHAGRLHRSGMQRRHEQ